MSAILERLAADGLTLSVSPEGNIDIIGDQNMVNSWIRTIRENKAAILSELQSRRILQELANDSGKKYFVIVTDASTDPVLVKVAIRGLAIFDMQIPHAYYDGIALIEAIEQYSAEAALKLVVNTFPSPNVLERSHGFPDKQERAA